MSGGRGHRLLLALGADHQENEFLGFGNELTVLFCSNQRDSGRRWYLWYPLKLISQINNNSARPRLILSMVVIIIHQKHQ